MPKRGTLRAHSGLKCPSRQILPPRYLVRVKVRVRVRLRLSGSGLGARVRGSGSGQVHLLRLAVELGQRELGRHARVAHGNVELQVELVLDRVVEGPHLALPPRAGLVRRLDRKPLVARLFVDLLVLRAAAARRRRVSTGGGARERQAAAPG